MTITSIATFTMRRGRERGALKMIQAVKKQADKEQPGTLVYLVHRVLKGKKPSRQLYFYERYRNRAALDRHLASTSWKAVVGNWREYFEGASSANITFFGVERIGAFARPGAIPITSERRAKRKGTTA